ncbi:MAG: hypothetical protein ILO36_04615, partial [Abditibacteriota bacterium]|nr:hypothetical protein [Abditibacteriota bacterium]
MEKTKAIIIRANHFDPVWRRCWDRPFYDGGRRFASYREIEGYFFDDALESGEAFSCESAWTIRKYLEKHPERLEEVKRLHGEGKFELLGAGENIIDTNMPGTECLIRNLVIGLLWGRDTFGETPSIPCFTDVFGSSCQLPQLVRGCGMLPWIFQLDYNVPDGPVWKGVDGSCVAWGFPDTAPGCCPCDVIPFGKHEPCSHCRGEGCPECGGRGFLPVYTAVLNKMPENVPEGAKVLRCNLAGEEILPDKELGRHIREMNAASADLHFEAGVMKDLLPYVREHIALADSPGDVSGRAENNPAQTGCYVSRIKVKQLEREIESLMAACEARDALLDNGRQHEALREIWRDITFICQHDAVTGDHIDQAYGEITEFEEDIRKRLLGCLESVKAPGEGFVVYNHNGFAADLPARTPFRHPEVRDAEGEPVPVYSDGSFTAKGVEAFSAKAYSICEGEPQTPRKGKEGVYSMDGFTLTAGPCGIEKAEHSRFGRFTGTDFYFGEPVLETDIGDPWCTRHKDRTRDRLSAYTRLEGVEIYPHEIRINYSGRHPKGTGHLASDAAMIFDFAWSQTFVLREGTGRIDVETRVRWFTGNCRLRLAFPSASSADEGVYEVPGAVIKRPRYEHTGYDPLSGA